VARATVPGGQSHADTLSIRVVAPPAVGFTQVAAGQDYGCGLTAGGQIYCWGNNQEGVFGNGTSTSSPTPVLAGGGFQYVAIAPGSDHMCALKANGVVACWGNNDFGQLGNGTTTTSLFPVAAQGGPYSALSVGSLHSCAISAGDALRCWGYNNRGELGLGTPGGFITVPTLVVGGHEWASVSAGGNSTCGIMLDGLARCWGRNYHGLLGKGDTVSTATPTLVDSTAGRTWSAVSVGWVHACAVESGTLDIFCWGDNVSDQLGLSTGPDAVSHPFPYRVAPGLAPLVLSAGYRHTCILPGSGGYSCWGENGSGEVGGTDPTGGTWTGISASLGWVFTCGVQSNGSIWCWGDNTYGELGNGTTTDSSVPVQVTLPAGPAGVRGR
jgi:alpha-tubulin suppressor-like RCC1 family protein